MITLMRRLAASLCTAALALSAAQAQEGVQPDTILLGQSGARTGPLAELNEDYLSGANLYFEALNARGGVHGRRIRLITQDDAYDPEKAARNVKALIETDKVFALFACFGTGPSLKALPVVSAARVPFFAPYTGADSLREPLNPWVFHLRASYRQEIEKIVEHLTSLGITSIGVVHHADPFGNAGRLAAEQALQRKGLTPLAVVPIQASGDDAPAAVAAVNKANPAALILVTAGKSSAAFIRAQQSSDLRPMLYGLSVISSRQLIRELGPQAHGLVIAQVMPSPFRLDHAVVREYRQLAEKAGQAYSYTALEGYVAAKTFSEALRRAGRDINRDKLAQALEGLQNWDAGGVKVDFSSRQHQAMNFVDLDVISRGQFTR